MAFHLSSLAATSHILLSQNTVESIGDTFTVVEKGDMQLKRRRKLVKVFELNLDKSPASPIAVHEQRCSSTFSPLFALVNKIGASISTDIDWSCSWVIALSSTRSNLFANSTSIACGFTSLICWA